MEKNEEQKVWVNVSETINTGAYQNIKIEAGFSLVYSKKENPIELIEQGIDEVTVLLKRKRKQINKHKKRKE